MKYGIITYTSAQNWGGILQAYALYSYLKKSGVDCELINYRSFDDKWFKPRKQLKDIAYSIVMYNKDKLRIERYKKFRLEKLGLNEQGIVTSKDLINLNNVYDAFITGSDQLWNCETTICYDFYLRFANKNKILLAYGPSFGQDKIPIRFEDEVKNLLERYDMKSVREESGRKIVQKLTGEEIPVVCDPAFLLSADEWENVANKDIKEEEYIFIYTTEVSSKVINLVKNYKKAHPLVKVITPYAIPGVKAEVRKDIGPAEFLSYLKNADYIIGTSFHAVVFSLIFQKDFCVVPHSSTGARVNDLLSRLGLENHAINNETGIQFPRLQDANQKYQSLLNEYIDTSKKYIVNMINCRK